MKFSIEGRKIGPKHPCYIIAEIGINHEGDSKVAMEMMEQAFQVGADAVKLQIVEVEESYAKGTESYEMFSSSTLSDKALKNMVKKAKKMGGFLFATAGDPLSVTRCVNAGMQAFKVSSGLLNNIPLIRILGKTKKPIILSTGMSNISEVKESINVAKNSGANDIAVLQCTSIYPAPAETLNLNTIKTLSKECGVVSGYSDHYLGSLSCVAAVALGASIIEKHFTITPASKGFDHHISLEPSSFKDMVDKIRLVEKMLGNDIKEPTKEELLKKALIRRYCVAKENIYAGDAITLENISYKRVLNPSNGVEVSNFDQILGRKLTTNVKAGQNVERWMLE